MQIDHKGPNLTFLTFKMTFRVTAHHLHGARKLGNTSVLLNNIDKYVKRGQSDLSYLEKLPLERFHQNHLLTVLSTIIRKLHVKIEKNQFLRNLEKCLKTATGAILGGT